jgi:1-acyl-sn-glycerol-3-phosphate acyltransferase
MVYHILEVFTRLSLGPLFRLRVHHSKIIPKKGGFILASNHVSFLDPIILGVASRRKLSYMARDTLFRNCLFAWLLYRIETFPLKRSSADLSALKEALSRLRAGKGLVLFPEGRRRDQQGQYGEPLAGVGFLAAKSGMPVIPAFIKGTDRAMPRGSWFIRPYQISVYFGSAFFVDSRMPYRETAQLVMQKISHLGQNSS